MKTESAQNYDFKHWFYHYFILAIKGLFTFYSAYLKTLNQLDDVICTFLPGEETNTEKNEHYEEQAIGSSEIGNFWLKPRKKSNHERS